MSLFEWIKEFINQVIKAYVQVIVWVLRSIKLSILEALAAHSPTFAALLAAEKLKTGVVGSIQDLFISPADLVKGPFEVFGKVANNIKDGKLPIPIPDIFDKSGDGGFLLPKLPNIFDKGDGQGFLPKLPIPSIFDKDGGSKLPLPIPKLPIPSIFGKDKDESAGSGSALPIPLPKLPIPSLLGGKDKDESGGFGSLPLKLPIPSILGKDKDESGASGSILPIPLPKLPIPSLFGNDKNASSTTTTESSEKPSTAVDATLPTLPIPLPKLPIPNIFDKDGHDAPKLPIPKLTSILG